MKSNWPLTISSLGNDESRKEWGLNLSSEEMSRILSVPTLDEAIKIIKVPIHNLGFGQDSFVDFRDVMKMANEKGFISCRMEVVNLILGTLNIIEEREIFYIGIDPILIEGWYKIIVMDCIYGNKSLSTKPVYPKMESCLKYECFIGESIPSWHELVLEIP